MWGAFCFLFFFFSIKWFLNSCGFLFVWVWIEAVMHTRQTVLLLMYLGPRHFVVCMRRELTVQPRRASNCNRARISYKHRCKPPCLEKQSFLPKLKMCEDSWMSASNMDTILYWKIWTSGGQFSLSLFSAVSNGTFKEQKMLNDFPTYCFKRHYSLDHKHPDSHVLFFLPCIALFIRISFFCKGECYLSSCITLKLLNLILYSKVKHI